jgi:5-formyltetrahydrofolate cyclo-ligase
LSDKQELRRRILEKRKKLENHSFLSSQISRNILNWEIFRAKEKILSYFPVKGEVDISAVNRQILEEKELYYPVILKEGEDAPAIIPVRMFKGDALVEGLYKIPVPPPGNPSAGKNSLDIVLVPGIVFDRTGSRIGFGRGYYDKFLHNCEAVKAGICFEIQVVEKINSDETDEKVDFLITENGVFDVLEV